MNNINKSYLLWMLGFLGFSGVHRLYNRKVFTGVLWFVTFGLFGVGQFVDLFIIPRMVEEYNARLMFKRMFNQSSNHRMLTEQVSEGFVPSRVHQLLPDDAMDVGKPHVL